MVRRRFLDNRLLLALTLQQAHDIAALGGALELAAYPFKDHRNRRPDNLQVSQLFGGDVYQEIIFVWMRPRRYASRRVRHTAEAAIQVPDS